MRRRRPIGSQRSAGARPVDDTAARRRSALRASGETRRSLRKSSSRPRSARRTLQDVPIAITVVTRRGARAGQHHRRDRHQAPGHQPSICREPERARHQPADPRRRHAELLQRPGAVGRHGGRRCRDGPQRHGQRRPARRRSCRSPARTPGHAVREERVGGPGLDRLEAPDRRTERRRTHLVRHLRRTAGLGGRECPAHGPGGIPGGRLLQQPRRPGDERLRRREAQRPRRSRLQGAAALAVRRTTTGRSM